MRSDEILRYFGNVREGSDWDYLVIVDDLNGAEQMTLRGEMVDVSVFDVEIFQSFFFFFLAYDGRFG